jgi:YCII-related domain.
VDFLIYSRGRPSVANADVPELDEHHWTYMDGFADRMMARGPTLGADRKSWTGSMHIVDLPGPDAAREFVDLEPYNRAGAYERHFLWRFTNLLGRTMWQFAGAPDEPRFLVLAQGGRAIPVADLPVELRDRVIMYGELRDLGDDEPAGVALAVQAPARETLDALLADPRIGFGDVEIHDWEFGGRR